MEAHARGVLASAQGSRLPHRIMGIDLALRNVGLIVFTEEGHVLRRKTISYKMRRKNDIDAPLDEADHLGRLLNVANEVVGWAKIFNIKHVGVEGFAFEKKYQAHQIGQMAGVVKVQLWLACRVVTREIEMATARKYLLGHGRPKKENIELVVKAVIPDIEDDHQADAYVVARYLYDTLAGNKVDDGTSKKKKKRRKTKPVEDKQSSLGID